MLERGRKGKGSRTKGEEREKAGGKRERSIRRKRVFVEIGKRAGRKKRKDVGEKRKLQEQVGREGR